MILTDLLAQSLDDIVNRIETGKALDRAAGPLNAAVLSVFRNGRVRDALSGRALGHPAHPALVSGPIGCWTGALVADLFGESRAARVLTAAGVLSAVPVAATGFSDWANTTGAEQRVGAVHMATNLVATVMYAGSWWARSRGRELLGVSLGVGGAILATGAGWLGGHLAYVLGVGVDTNAFSGGPEEWSPAIAAKTGSGPIRSASAAGVSLVLVGLHDGSVPTDEGLHVLADRCSHRGGPLSEGRLVGSCIECPWHKSEFDVRTGAVRRGPAVVAQPVYEVRVVEDGVQVRRDEPRSLRLNPVRP